MSKNIADVYTNQIKFLIKLKKSVSDINNQLHDNLAFLTIEQLKIKFPNLTFSYINAGNPGYDIKGSNERDEIELICEVKTTLPNSKNKLEGQQLKAIKNDLERLEKAAKIKYKFLVLLSTTTKQAIENQINLKDFPSVELINILNENFSENE